MAERPKLTDYTRTGAAPVAAAASSVPPAAPTPTPVAHTAAQPDLDAEAEKILAATGKDTAADRETKARLSIYEDISQALTPVKNYEEFLQTHEISLEKAEEIADNILMKGYHEETYPITKRSAVVLRTRAHRDTLRMHAALNVQNPMYQDVANEIIIRYNLAASLAAITGPAAVSFEFPKETDTEEKAMELFDIRMRWIESHAGALFAKLSLKLSQFDRMVMAVMREGVTENF